MDQVFGEWTCRICGRQEYGEKSMKKHVAVKHERPPHTCGKKDDQDWTTSFGDGNNNESDQAGLGGIDFETMETESVDSAAETVCEEVEEVKGMDLMQINDQNLTSLKGKINRSEKELGTKESPNAILLKPPKTRRGKEIVQMEDSFKCIDVVNGEFACNICNYTAYQKGLMLKHVSKKHEIQTTANIDKGDKKKHQIMAGTEEE